MTIAGTLNIAKEALLTHMSAITVAGHNIANVNTLVIPGRFWA